VPVLLCASAGIATGLPSVWPMAAMARATDSA